MANLKDTIVNGNLEVSGDILVNETSISNSFTKLNNIEYLLKGINYFITTGVAGNSSIELIKPIQYHCILIIFRGNGVDLFTIDKWNHIGQISGDTRSGVSITSTESGNIAESTLTITNSIGAYRLIWGVMFSA